MAVILDYRYSGASRDSVRHCRPPIAPASNQRLGSNRKPHPFTPLKRRQNLGQVHQRRAPLRPQHPHQTLGRNLRPRFQFPKAHRRIHIIPQQPPSRPKLPVQKALCGLPQQRFAELRLRLRPGPNRLAPLFPVSYNRPNAPGPLRYPSAAASSCRRRPDPPPRSWSLRQTTAADDAKRREYRASLE